MKPTYWGLEVQLDLYYCNPDTIRSKVQIENWTRELVQLIDMKAYGEPLIVHFGDSPKVCGYSLVQLIETSCITGHFAESTNNAYLNVFSCKEYDPEVVKVFSVDFYEAKGCAINTTARL
jgi:S-adenosylmethionine/arginine decarboxylase-like enzyme